jgi:hypothetical protein
MFRTLSSLLVGTAICAAGLVSAVAQEPKGSTRPEIPGGIVGHVKSVDHEKHTLSVTTPGGRARTFTITDDTTMLGPRGGKVRRRLRDRRFHEGMEITVVAEGSTAKELHLGFSRREHADSGDGTKSAANPVIPPSDDRRDRTRAIAGAVRGKAAAEISAPAAATGAKTAARAEEDDEDDEIPGRVKSYDANRRLLVVTLLNGKSRSFLLSQNVKVVVRGRASTSGLRDPSLRADAPVTVFVAAGGRRVTELHVLPAQASRSRKAG